MNNCLNELNKGCYELKKKTSGLIEISIRESNYCMLFMEASRSTVCYLWKPIDQRFSK